MDLKVAGASNIPSGKYSNIAIKGTSRMLGDIQCDNFFVSGVVKGESVECNGKVKIYGKAIFNNNVKSQDIEVKGKLIALDVEVADEFDCNGGVVCDNLKAKEIELNNSGSTSIQQIEGQDIEITMSASKKFLRSILFFSRKKKEGLNVQVRDYIQGEDISLQYVTTPKVSGKNIVIGDGCKIDLVEYKDVIVISPKAKVGKVNKV